MRDLERLQDVVEYRVSPGQLRLALLGALAVSCGIFAVGVSVGKRLDSGTPGVAVDPLAELDRATRPAAAAANVEDEEEEAPPLTYHDELTSRGDDARASDAPRREPPSAAGERGDDATSAPADGSASENDDAVEDEPAVPDQPHPGESAVYTLQVASYETRDEAQQFANDLRSRGHHVFLVRTSTPDRGTWYRVRVGPFHSRREATRAQARFERTERLPTFLVRRRR